MHACNASLAYVLNLECICKHFWLAHSHQCARDVHEGLTCAHMHTRTGACPQLVELRAPAQKFRGQLEIIAQRAFDLMLDNTKRLAEGHLNNCVQTQKALESAGRESTDAGECLSWLTQVLLPRDFRQ